MRVTRLRVWWTRNLPAAPHYFPVVSVGEAKRVLLQLSGADLALGDLIESNAGGLEENSGNGWEEWEDVDGNNIDDTSLE